MRMYGKDFDVTLNCDRVSGGLASGMQQTGFGVTVTRDSAWHTALEPNCTQDRWKICSKADILF